jgi:hypothetical protein
VAVVEWARRSGHGSEPTGSVSVGAREARPRPEWSHGDAALVDGVAEAAQQHQVLERPSFVIGHRLDEPGRPWERSVDVRDLHRDDRLAFDQFKDRVRAVGEVAGAARQPVQRLLHP